MKLFCPGPVMVSKNVKKSLMECEIGHRSPMFEELYQNIKTNILSLAQANDDYDVVCLSASGSAANEAVIASVFSKNDHILILSNGVFGNRVKTLMEIYSLNFDVYDKSYGEVFNPQEIDTILKQGNYSYVFFTHHETSCGMINEISPISEVCKRHGVRLFIDAVSSFGAEKLDVAFDNIDIITSVSGKCIGATPGVSYIIMKKQIFANLNESVNNSYLNLNKYYDFSINKNQTPNTPNVSAFNALNTALSEYNDEFKGQRYLALSNYLRDELERLGVEFLIPRELMSSCVTSIIAPKELYQQLYDNGYITYLGDSRYYDKSIIQITVMGDLSMQDCTEFIQVFSQLY